MWVFTGADRLVIAAHSSPSELGAYGLAATLIGPFTVFTLALGQAWIPRIASLNVQSPGAARSATSSAIGLSLAGLGSAALVVGTLAPWLVGVVGGDDYSAGARAVPFLALGAAFYGSALFTSTGLTLAKRTAAIPLVTAGAAMVDIALLLLLVPRAGMVGASLSVASAYLALALGTLYFANRAFPLLVDGLSLALTVVVLSAQATISTALPGTPWSGVSLLGAVGAVVGLAIRSRSRQPGADPI
jgi:O-antigen/teichoic acid export membrane protein